MTFDDLAVGDLFYFARDGSEAGGEAPLLKVCILVHDDVTDTTEEVEGYADVSVGNAWAALPHEKRLGVTRTTRELWWVEPAHEGSDDA